jgi:hypothetical protein
LTSIFQARQFAPVWICIGLAMLLAAPRWPALPEVTAMGLVALGATGVTLARFRGTPALLPVLAMHATVYGTLYVLFVGAAIHAATRGDAGPSLPAAVDLVASAWPVAISLSLIANGLQPTRKTRDTRDSRVK